MAEPIGYTYRFPEDDQRAYFWWVFDKAGFTTEINQGQECVALRSKSSGVDVGIWHTCSSPPRIETFLLTPQGQALPEGKALDEFMRKYNPSKQPSS